MGCGGPHALVAPLIDSRCFFSIFRTWKTIPFRCCCCRLVRARPPFSLYPLRSLLAWFHFELWAQQRKQWCRRGECKRTPKILIWWKSGKILCKPSQNPWKSGQTPRKYERKWRPTSFDFKTMAPNVVWVEETAPNTVFMRKYSHKKWPKFFSGKLGETRAKTLRNPRKFACSYTYERVSASHRLQREFNRSTLKLPGSVVQKAELLPELRKSFYRTVILICPVSHSGDIDHTHRNSRNLTPMVKSSPEDFKISFAWGQPNVSSFPLASCSSIHSILSTPEKCDYGPICFFQL